MNSDFPKSLRILADFYDTHPDFPQPDLRFAVGEANGKEAAAKVIRAFGSCVKEYSDAMFHIKKQFGCICLDVLFYRTDVCEAIVVGKKLIPATPAVEAKPEHEEDIIEWRCNPVLAPQTTEAA